MSRRGRVWQEGRAKDAKALRDVPWYFVVDIAPKGAPRRQVKQRGFPTQAAAQEALDKLLDDIRDGTRVEPSRDTFGAYLKVWTQSLPATGRRPSTVASYRNTVDAHVLRNDVADVPLQGLAARTPEDTTELYDVLVARGLLQARSEMLAGLEREGVMVLDTVPERLTVDAVNRYLSLKTGVRL